MPGKAVVGEGDLEDLEGQGAGPPPSWLVLQLNSQYLQIQIQIQDKKTWQGQFQNLFTLHYHQEDFWMGCQNISR